jgi:hypothetical protein
MPDYVEPSQAELLRVEARHEGAEAIITAAGELEYSTAERFVACILEVLDQAALDHRRPPRSHVLGLLWPVGLAPSS